MKVLASDVLSREVIDFLLREIQANDGHEVSFAGNVDRNGAVIEAVTMAYGNEDSTPVVMLEALQGDVLIHNHPSGVLTPSQADIALSTLLANKKIGFYIVDNSCDYVNVVLKPEPRVYLQEEEIFSIFQPGGLLSQNIPQFEPRAEQGEMVEKVVEAINDTKILLCEAGTGTGKSLSYLIPATVWAIQNKKRVLITTHTINLQHQIFHKDMEIVSQITGSYLDKKVNYAVLLGKRNYLCKRRLYDLLKDYDQQETLFEQDASGSLTEIEAWCRNAVDGTRSEFGIPVSEEIWEEVACDYMNCTRKKCRYYGECFYYAARLQAEKSNIIIANHSLVFSTIEETSFNSTLPHFSGVVFDEGHHIEDVALKALSRDFTMQGALFHLRKLVVEKKGERHGLLVLLQRKGRFDGYTEIRESYLALTDLILSLTGGFQDALYEIKDILAGENSDSGTIGMDEYFVATECYRIIQAKLKDLFEKLKIYLVQFETVADRIRDVASDETVVEILRNIGYRHVYLEEIRRNFELIFNSETNPEYVKWIEPTYKNIRFAYSPLELNDFLANSIFSKKEFTVITSATLMINKKFDYLKSSVGLQLVTNREKIELALSSPFDYRKQAEIFILNEQVEHTSVTREKTQLVKELCLISEGGALVLFTSYNRLKEMFELLKNDLMENGLLPIKQGDRTRHDLLNIMKTRSYAVLFATSSFWEGIDIQGENLRCVIIEKLPFDNPADPLYRAKVKLLESRNLNPFVSYSIPRAVLRLKQGLGRLIRSKTDRGIIAILDNRLRTKSYGMVFLNSLPPAKIVYAPVRTIILQAEAFFVDYFQRLKKNFSLVNEAIPAGELPATVRKKWSGEEDEVLEEAFHQGISPEELAPRLNRKPEAIKERMKKLGLEHPADIPDGSGKGNGYKKWTPEDDEILKQEYLSGKKTAEIGVILDRKPYSIRARLKKLHLTK